MTNDDCYFCMIAAGRPCRPKVLRWWDDAVMVKPSSPVTASHVLIIPTSHATSISEKPEVADATMRRALEAAAELPHADVIMSHQDTTGNPVEHLHAHVMSRWPLATLAMPWTRPELIVLDDVLKALAHFAPSDFGKYLDCWSTNVMARLLRLSGNNGAAIELLVSHAEVDDRFDAHFGLTRARAAVLPL